MIINVRAAAHLGQAERAARLANVVENVACGPNNGSDPPELLSEVEQRSAWCGESEVIESSIAFWLEGEHG